MDHNPGYHGGRRSSIDTLSIESSDEDTQVDSRTGDNWNQFLRETSRQTTPSNSAKNPRSAKTKNGDKMNLSVHGKNYGYKSPGRGKQSYVGMRAKPPSGNPRKSGSVDNTPRTPRSPRMPKRNDRVSKPKLDLTVNASGKYQMTETRRDGNQSYYDGSDTKTKNGYNYVSPSTMYNGSYILNRKPPRKDNVYNDTRKYKSSSFCISDTSLYNRSFKYPENIDEFVRENCPKGAQYFFDKAYETVAIESEFGSPLKRALPAHYYESTSQNRTVRSALAKKRARTRTPNQPIEYGSSENTESPWCFACPNNNVEIFSPESPEHKSDINILAVKGRSHNKDLYMEILQTSRSAHNEDVWAVANRMRTPTIAPRRYNEVRLNTPTIELRLPSAKHLQRSTNGASSRPISRASTLSIPIPGTAGRPR